MITHLQFAVLCALGDGARTSAQVFDYFATLSRVLGGSPPKPLSVKLCLARLVITGLAGYRGGYFLRSAGAEAYNELARFYQELPEALDEAQCSEWRQN